MKIKSLIEPLRTRLFWLKYGVLFLRSSRFHVKRLKLGNHVVNLSIPSGEDKVMNYELKTILYDDCYGLRGIDGSVNSVLDIGGNLGFFSLAARSQFPEARIHTYEPNPAVHQHLFANLKGLSIDIHPEGIGATDGWLNLKIDGSTLLAKTESSESGNIKKTAIASALDRIGGSVDLLKLDCEGAEWELFDTPQIWKRVNHLTMEYHLWANPKLDVSDMIKIIRGYGFRVTHLSEAPELKWGILHATRCAGSSI